MSVALWTRGTPIAKAITEGHVPQRFRRSELLSELAALVYGSIFDHALRAIEESGKL
jgi:hypothetical protein